ncbi:MAG: histidine--tRNA ligase [Bacillota bacterium]|nr:histidine--tRNA ligase [Bacillota bacterium]
MLTTAPRGTNDFLPGDVEKWQYIERIVREICEHYGYQEIRTPIFEHTELFLRGVGDTTDIVEKEMYTFVDRGERSLTLRPEGTASTVRSFIEHKLYANPQPTKLYYLGPMFRYDRPQAGRYRQFHQFGIELFGTNHPSSDAEVIGLAMDFYKRLGLTGLEVRLNSVGCPSCRQEHKVKLQQYLEEKLASLCKNCQGRFERNPLRILDCKSSTCQELTVGAPTITTCLCPSCIDHFAAVKKYLDILNITYKLDETLVRGLDYYTNTAFEIVYQGIGAQSAIGGGGRYNGLVEQVGGQAIPGIGFGLGLERLLMTLEHQGVKLPLANKLDTFIVALGSAADGLGFKLMQELRTSGIKADKDYLEKNFKGQLKQADRKGAQYCIIIGEDELARNAAIVKHMASGSQEEIKVDEITKYLLSQLNKG